MTKKNTENKYNSDCHRSKGIYFRGVVVMVVKKQEIQDSGGGVWQKFALSKNVCTGCKKLTVTKGNHGSAFTSAELRYYSCFMYLVLIYSTSSKSIKLGLECEASTKAPQKLNPENAKTGVLSRQETYKTEPLWIFDRTKLKNIIFSLKAMQFLKNQIHFVFNLKEKYRIPPNDC